MLESLEVSVKTLNQALSGILQQKSMNTLKITKMNSKKYVIRKHNFVHTKMGL